MARAVATSFRLLQHIGHDRQGRPILNGPARQQHCQNVVIPAAAELTVSGSIGWLAGRGPLTTSVRREAR